LPIDLAAKEDAMKMNTLYFFTMTCALALAGCATDSDEPVARADAMPAASADAAPADPCSVTVPASATVIAQGANLDLVDGGRYVVVCTGATLISHGGNTKVFVLEGGVANINGGGSRVHSQGATTLNVNADDVTVVHDGGATVTDNGQNTVVDTCTTVTIDISATAGC
jgi:hypothetical protein